MHMVTILCPNKFIHYPYLLNKYLSGISVLGTILCTWKYQWIKQKNVYSHRDYIRVDRDRNNLK